MHRKVAVVYPYLPHYRYGVFRELVQRNPKTEFTFLAGKRSPNRSIPTIGPHQLKRQILVRNFWFGPFLWQMGLWRNLRANRPDVIIFLGDYAYLSTWFSACWARLSGIPVLFWTIGWHKRDVGIRRYARLAFYSLADQLLIYGRTGKRIGTSLGVPAHKMTVIFNSGLSSMSNQPDDDEHLQAFVRSLPAQGVEVVSAVIRLNPAKRLDLLILAVAKLRDQGRHVTVLLVGEGPDRDRLASLASRLNVELIMPGPAYSRLALAAVYARTRVTVIPSVAGLSVLQSLEHGRPVITHDDIYAQAPESEAILPGKTGDYYRHNDVDDLASTINRWLDAQWASEAATANACRTTIEEHWSPVPHADAISQAVNVAWRAKGARQ